MLNDNNIKNKYAVGKIANARLLLTEVIFQITFQNAREIFERLQLLQV